MLANMYVHHMHARYPEKQEEGISSPGTGVTGSYELPDVGARN